MDYAAWVTPAVREVLEKPILVIGCGSIGKRHIENLHALGARRIEVCDPNLANMMGISLEAWNVVCAPVSIERAPSSPAPIAALICSPTRNHYMDFMSCFAANIPNIFVEKPVDDVEKNVVRELPHTNTLVACNLRFLSMLRHMKRLIDEGTLGKVISARANFGYDLAKWRLGTDHKKSYSANKSMGGGILLDAIHEWDYMSWLFGDLAEAKGFKARLTDVTVDTEDVVEVALRFKSGVVGSIHADYLAPKYTRTLWVTTTKGEAGWTLDAPAGKEYLWGLAAEGESYLVNKIDVNDMYVEEMKHFLRVCAGEEKSCNTVSQAYKLLEVVLRATE